MTRRWTTLSAAEIAAKSLANRAARQSPVKNSHPPVEKPKKAATKRDKVPTEHQEQVKVIQWWNSYALYVGLDPRLLFAVPNGSNKSMASAARFKAEGLRAGVPDLFLAHSEWKGRPMSLWRGLFIEMKRTKGSVMSEEQKSMITLLQSQGYQVAVCKGADEAIATIRRYLE